MTAEIVYQLNDFTEDIVTVVPDGEAAYFTNYSSGQCWEYAVRVSSDGRQTAIFGRDTSQLSAEAITDNTLLESRQNRQRLLRPGESYRRDYLSASGSVGALLIKNTTEV